MPLNNSCCVIVVDDDADDLFIIEQALRRYSPECQVELLETGADLLSNLASSSNLPSLILLDLNMPRMNGLETLRLIRQERSSQELPVVILTTSDQAQDQQQARQLEANDFITKPATLTGYSDVVQQLRKKWLLGRCI